MGLKTVAKEPEEQEEITQSVSKVSQLDRALALATEPEDIKDFRDKAQTYVLWLKQIGAATEDINVAAELKLRAERKLGEWLDVNVGAGGDRKSEKSKLQDVTLIRDLPHGISKIQSHRWQLIALIPENIFEHEISDIKAREKVITTDYFIRLGRKYARISRREDLIAEPPPFPNGVFGLIYADPPWEYDFALTETRHIENHYPTMAIEDICDMEVRGVRVQERASENALLYLWATSPKLEEAIAVINAWEFEYVTNMVWVKDKIGMGYYARQQHELLLIAKRGTPPLVLTRPEDRPASVLTGSRGKHSEKPIHVYSMLNTLYPGLPKLELFNRGVPPDIDVKDWTFWGAEAA